MSGPPRSSDIARCLRCVCFTGQKDRLRHSQSNPKRTLHDFKVEAEDAKFRPPSRDGPGVVECLAESEGSSVRQSIDPERSLPNIAYR